MVHLNGICRFLQGPKGLTDVLKCTQKCTLKPPDCIWHQHGMAFAPEGTRLNRPIPGSALSWGPEGLPGRGGGGGCAGPGKSLPSEGPQKAGEIKVAT